MIFKIKLSRACYKTHLYIRYVGNMVKIHRSNKFLNNVWWLQFRLPYCSNWNINNNELVLCGTISPTLTINY